MSSSLLCMPVRPAMYVRAVSLLIMRRLNKENYKFASSVTFTFHFVKTFSFLVHEVPKI